MATNRVTYVDQPPLESRQWRPTFVQALIGALFGISNHDDLPAYPALMMTIYPPCDAFYASLDVKMRDFPT